MNSLILIAHGSRLTESNDEIRTLTAQLRTALGDAYARVECAYLELSQPSIPEAIDAAVHAGAQKIVLLPYFLAAGTHIQHHIPAIVSDKRAQYPHTEMELRPHIGQSQAMIELLCNCA